MSIEVFAYTVGSAYSVEQRKSVPRHVSSAATDPVRLSQPLPRETPIHMTFGIETAQPFTEQAGDATRVLDCHPSFVAEPA